MAPPGYLLSSKFLNSDHVSGMRRSWVTKTAALADTLEAMQRLHTGVANLKEDYNRLTELVGLLAA